MGDRYVDQDGIAGQGNPDPISRFENHAVVVLGAMIYDPSYGGAFTNLARWEDGSLDYLVYMNEFLGYEVKVNTFGTFQTEFY